MRFKPNFIKYFLLFVSMICCNGYAQLDPFTSAFGPRTADIKAAAEAGNAAAQFRLGQEYHSRFSWTNAAVWYRKSARQGNADAQNALGTYLLEGKPGIKANTPEGMGLLLSAANQGQVSAQHRLAGIYERGKHVKVDYVESLKWYTLAEKKLPIVARVQADALILKMTAEQIAEGKKRAASFVPTAPVKSVPALKLQGIIGTGTKSMAIINGKNFMTGDQQTIKVDGEALGVRCLSITNGLVTVSVTGETQPRVLQIK